MLVVTARRSLRRHDTTATLRRMVPGAPSNSFDADAAMRAVRRVSRLLGANCLTQSVALTVAAARAGLDPELILGCRRYGDNKWGAHAWMVLAGRTYDPLPSGEHQALATISAGTSWVPAPIVRGVH
ncbi:MAG TPA: lasso peptide biosynthesis B2 protein [Acidimicrobiales bacterium]|nr:lasso peptide biosynthesis B2 protein [Acidimicrobiales bacterium]